MIVKKGTIYIGGLFGYKKIEAREIEHGVNKYAQYLDAVFVKFIPKNARYPRILQEGYRPRIVVLDGWNHPDPPPIYMMVQGKSNMRITEISGSQNVDDKFNLFLDSYLSNNVVVHADTRGFKPITG